MLDLARIEDEKRENTLTIIQGVLSLDEGKIADRILTLSLAELIKTKAAEKEKSPDKSGIVEEMPEKPKKRGKSEPKASEPINSPSEPNKPQNEGFSEKLPWEEEKTNLLESELEL